MKITKVPGGNDFHEGKDATKDATEDGDTQGLDIRQRPLFPGVRVPNYPFGSKKLSVTTKGVRRKLGATVVPRLIIKKKRWRS